jgi:hypothetical protein
VVLLEVLTQVLGVAPDGIGLPQGVGTGGLGHIKLGLFTFVTNHEGGDAEGADSSLLGIFLLGLGDEASNIFKRRLILKVESETLALKAGFVDKDSGISLETCESKHNMLINLQDLADCVRVLESSCCLLLNSKNDTVLSLDADSGRSTVHSLEGILNLEEVAIGGEDSYSFVVSRHCK